MNYKIQSFQDPLHLHHHHLDGGGVRLQHWIL